jgi:hypothetical protein
MANTYTKLLTTSSSHAVAPLRGLNRSLDAVSFPGADAHVAEDYVEAVCRAMERANWHTYRVLTKRSSRLRNLFQGRIRFAVDLRNIWWGVSVEDRAHGLIRIEHLRQAPAAGPFPLDRATPRRSGADQSGWNPLGDRRRRERTRCAADAEGLGAFHSRSVRTSPSSLLLQAVGRSPQEQDRTGTGWKDLRRSSDPSRVARHGECVSHGRDRRNRGVVPRGEPAIASNACSPRCRG